MSDEAKKALDQCETIYSRLRSLTTTENATKDDYLIGCDELYNQIKKIRHALEAVRGDGAEVLKGKAVNAFFNGLMFARKQGRRDLIDRISKVVDMCHEHFRESLAQFMLKNSIATGHGDTFDDLMEELQGEIDDMRALTPPDNADLVAVRDALIVAEEYFDNRADADCDQDGYIPNEEMRLLVDVREAIATLNRMMGEEGATP